MLYFVVTTCPGNVCHDLNMYSLVVLKGVVLLP